MNKKQRKILEFLAKCEPSEFVTQEEISKQTGISLINVGSECYKLREIKFLEHSASSIGEKLKYRITVFGQNELGHEDDRNKNLAWMKKTTIATVGLLVVTGILAVGTIMLALDSGNQTELFQKDFDVSNRPWIGADDLNVYNDRIVIVLKNYGQIPNDSGTIYAKLTNYLFTQDDIRTNSNVYTLHVTMPEQILKHVVTSEIYDEMMSKAKNHTWEVFLGAEIDYPYGDNGNGNYGFIGKYNPESNEIDILETWGS